MTMMFWRRVFFAFRLKLRTEPLLFGRLRRIPIFMLPFGKGSGSGTSLLDNYVPGDTVLGVFVGGR